MLMAKLLLVFVILIENWVLIFVMMRAAIRRGVYRDRVYLGAVILDTYHNKLHQRCELIEFDSIGAISVVRFIWIIITPTKIQNAPINSD
jgi:hypothetical protein